ncbi:MAG: FecR family protein [Geothrix sp.]|nr:FecR family protein [Geothrix sp.]
MIPLLAPLAFVLLQAPAPGPEALAYRFDEVKHSVHRWPGGDKGKEVKVAPGDGASSGDLVRTGWWGQTVISVPDRQSRFEVYANTQVRLAGGEPGVLLVLEQGRIKAFFQVLVGGSPPERQVAVPGALLAVRGTRYGVEVDKGGKSTLAVFEGVVEILRRDPHAEPVRVKAGEWSVFGPGLSPRVEPMAVRGFEEKTWNQGMRPDGSMGSGGMSSGSPMPGGMRSTQGPMQGPMHR